mmetsp:Transcript_82420/g.229658  ORF Transcript_82420/g.229658 Transcript_82420/m.229658 type:complete len:273 (-) Transcript_82420:1064-1882(-)
MARQRGLVAGREQQARQEPRLGAFCLPGIELRGLSRQDAALVHHGLQRDRAQVPDDLVIAVEQVDGEARLRRPLDYQRHCLMPAELDTLLLTSLPCSLFDFRLPVSSHLQVRGDDVGFRVANGRDLRYLLAVLEQLVDNKEELGVQREAEFRLLEINLTALALHRSLVLQSALPSQALLLDRDFFGKARSVVQLDHEGADEPHAGQRGPARQRRVEPHNLGSKLDFGLRQVEPLEFEFQLRGNPEVHGVVDVQHPPVHLRRVQLNAHGRRLL